MSAQFKALIRETAKWFLRVALVLVGFPVVLLVLVILLGFMGGLMEINCSYGIGYGIGILFLYARLPCLVLGSGHMENKLFLFQTTGGFLFIFVFYLFIAFCIGFMVGLLKTRKMKG